MGSPATMRAIGYFEAHPIDDPRLELVVVPRPVARPADLIVRPRAIGMNPVDTKIRRSRSGARPDAPVVLGWDAAGEVVEVGRDVESFRVGDRVFYAGDVTRPGTNAELQAVDHRLVARMPESLDFADAAALPLTALTAWEMLFEKLGITNEAPRDVLVIGGAGGVGAMAIQLLRALTPARVHATAGRPESQALVASLGATVVDRHAGLGAADSYDLVFATTHTDQYWSELPRVLRPFGAVGLIDDPGPLDIMPFKGKALSIHWELMFTKSRFGVRPESQGQILSKLARLVDAERVRTTARDVRDGITVPNLVAAHATLEAGAAVGKIVLAGDLA